MPRRVLLFLIFCPALCAQTRWWTQGDVSAEEQETLEWINRVRADPPGTLQALLAAAPGDPVLAGSFAAELPRTPAQLTTALAKACSLAAANAAAFPRSAATSSAPLVLYPLFEQQATAAAAAAAWPALVFPANRNPPSYYPEPPASNELQTGPGAIFTGPDTSGGTASFGPYGSNAWRTSLANLYLPSIGGREMILGWLCNPGSGSPPPAFLSQGDALPDLTLGHTRMAGIAVRAGTVPGARTLAFVRGSMEFLTASDLPFGAGKTVFVTGVIYRDQNGNGRYDAGEGLGGVAVTLDHGGWGARTGAAGGYAIPVPAGSGDYSATAEVTGAGPQPVAVTVGADNVKVDWVLAPLPPVLPPQEPVPAPDGNAALVNVSARGLVETGAWPLTAGFVIAGPAWARKRVLIRAVGPSLQTAGVPAARCVPATQIQLSDAAGVRAANAGWTNAADGGAAARSAAAECGAFPLTNWTGGGGDSALVLSLAPGLYTVAVAPAPEAPVFYATGHLGLAEVYDLSPGDGSVLVNLSARGTAADGDGALIVGASIGGSGHARILARASGPALASFGVKSYLAHPALTLFDARGQAIAENDAWSLSPQTMQIRTLAAATGAFPFPETGNDAALITPLPVGIATLQVTAAPGSPSGGIALVELYTAP